MSRDAFEQAIRSLATTLDEDIDVFAFLDGLKRKEENSSLDLPGLIRTNQLERLRQEVIGTLAIPSILSRHL